MIISDKEAAARLDSPINLINKLRKNELNNNRKNAMSLFIPATQKPDKPRAFLNPFNSNTDKQVESTLAATSSSNLIPVTTPAPQSATNPQPEIKVDSILENADSQIKLATAHDKALQLLNKSIDQLTIELDNVKADKLPSVISATSKVVESIRKERNEAAKLGKDREVHYHFYTPQTKRVEDYQVIDVQPTPATQ